MYGSKWWAPLFAMLTGGIVEYHAMKSDRPRSLARNNLLWLSVFVLVMSQNGLRRDFSACFVIAIRLVLVLISPMTVMPRKGIGVISLRDTLHPGSISLCKSLGYAGSNPSFGMFKSSRIVFFTCQFQQVCNLFASNGHNCIGQFPFVRIRSNLRWSHHSLLRHRA